jgi:hypothetical protein
MESIGRMDAPEQWRVLEILQCRAGNHHAIAMHLDLHAGLPHKQLERVHRAKAEPNLRLCGCEQRSIQLLERTINTLKRLLGTPSSIC